MRTTPLIALMLFTACKPEATPQAQEAEKTLTEFYKRYDIRGGWGIFAIEAKDRNVHISVNIPNRQAQDLLAFDEGKRKRFIAYNACPPFKEQVWSQLGSDGDIIIQARQKGAIFATASCRSDNQGMPL